MKKQSSVYTIYHYHSLAILILVIFTVGCAGSVPPQVAPPDPLAMSPEEVVESFYNWYIEYPGSPLANRGYAESLYLSEKMVVRLDELIASFEGGGYDPILCAQDLPNEIFVREATVSENTAEVPIESSFQGHSIVVNLVLRNGEWKIDGTSCMKP